MMQRQRWFRASALSATAVALMGVDKACVTSPTIDTVTTDSTLTLQGTIQELNSAGENQGSRDGQVRIRKNGTWLPWVSTVDKVWKYEGQALSVGINTFEGETRRPGAGGAWTLGSVADFVIERKTDLSARGTQKVFLDWSDAGIDDQLRAIATHTLNGPLTDAQLGGFVSDVKANVASFFQNAYSGATVQLVGSADADTHTVRFHGEDTCGLYGESPGDYKNQDKSQISEIYVGTFKCVVVDNDRLLSETPALKTDTLAQRVVDIGTFIGRTVAHEVAHSLGLTEDGSAGLHGCDGMHNCEAYDDANPTYRFDNGHHIMDPGPKSRLYARIGQENATTRKKKVPFFESYSKSYLKIVH